MPGYLLRNINHKTGGFRYFLSEEQGLRLLLVVLSWNTCGSLQYSSQRKHTKSYYIYRGKKNYLGGSQVSDEFSVQIN